MREEEVKIDLDTGGKRNSRFQRRKCQAIDSSEVKHEPRKRIKEKRLRENSVISVRILIVSRRAKNLRRSHSKTRDSSFSQEVSAMNVWNGIIFTEIVETRRLAVPVMAHIQLYYMTTPS